MEGFTPRRRCTINILSMVHDYDAIRTWVQFHIIEWRTQRVMFLKPDSVAAAPGMLTDRIYFALVLCFMSQNNSGG